MAVVIGDEYGPGGLGDEEWIAWRHVCLVLKRRGIEISKDDELVRLLKIWGERLALLRMVQGMTRGSGYSDVVIAESLDGLPEQPKGDELT